MTARIPLHKRLLVRLLITSGLIAVCSVAATAWLAVATTTQALREEQGQALADDMDVLAELSGYAATHPDWTEVAATVRELSARTGRRIALTAADRRVIADSAPPGTSLPPSAAAAVDPLHTDTYSERGAQLSGIDPRAVGPYRLTEAERLKVAALARKRQLCFSRFGVETSLSRTPSGRTVLTDDDSGSEPDYVPDACADGLLNTPTPTEEKAVRALQGLARDCLTKAGLDPRSTALLGTPPTGLDLRTPAPGKLAAKEARLVQPCLDQARRAQLDPYVAPVAELFLGTGDTPAVLFDMSPANKAKVVGTASLVLAVTVAATALVATRLVRPLRALTAAAQQPPELHVRVPVTTRDETGILAVAFNDLTERRERLEAQRKAMVSDIAHELRSPLTNIRGWLEVTRDGVVDPDPVLLASLHDEALVLQRVIDDLQDLADADAGTLRLHREPVRCDELLQQVAAAHRVAADAARVGLRTDVEGEPWLDADPVRMRQALGNLVSNALRHTPAGGTVTLSARRDGDDSVLEVADTGTGIAPDDLPHVFDRFWRAEKSRSRRTGGSGLGLPIVRHLVAAHDGTVAAASEPGTGSVFTLRMPWGPAPRPDA
ncbi:MULTISPECIES: HAMP domain-containing sensor histidine kinase [Streptomyces]|uniref:histidine kinase n=1 Tax=Streptomyces sviceus (strain ATCC 29083 / DSM 924 / JCM 4929 / NBRC 13980 / NCIMB 11184 / NRRL 5439 / UC 5370) TaxID=463191 RepID=B5I194_STRX2|nr:MULTISPECIES: HAMP domain-containing sensor histidine kinase [Streptomyces]EDY58849.2 sensor histidine kinase [Streptomyces sviceus ATCC 29083]MYT03650.1 HAMP domain-containing protein [Streptomyces sp. SID5470]